MPAYWFMYNMYALARNAWKYVDRDRRTDKPQLIEYDFLAPDSIGEIVGSLDQFTLITGRAWSLKHGARLNEQQQREKGRQLLEAQDPETDELELLADGVEHSNRKAVVIKLPQAYHLYKELVRYYAAAQVMQLVKDKGIKNRENLLQALPPAGQPVEWANAGGQLLPKTALQKLLDQVRAGKLKNWNDVHAFYLKQAALYPEQKLQHALAALQASHGIQLKKSKTALPELLMGSIATREWMVKNIYNSRAKDYSNPFRQMVYENRQEMDTVTGALGKNSFIVQEQEALDTYKRAVRRVCGWFK
jgi:hypothetical protein